MVSPSPLGISGQGGIQLVVIISSQPVLSRNLLPLSLSISLSVSLYLYLCLIVSILPHAVFNPISPFISIFFFFFLPSLYLHIPLVMRNELRRDPISFLFVICDCGAVCLSRKQFHEKLSAFIQFSKKKNARGDDILFFEHVCGFMCIYSIFFSCTYLIV